MTAHSSQWLMEKAAIAALPISTDHCFQVTRGKILGSVLNKHANHCR